MRLTAERETIEQRIVRWSENQVRESGVFCRLDCCKTRPGVDVPGGADGQRVAAMTTDSSVNVETSLFAASLKKSLAAAQLDTSQLVSIVKVAWAALDPPRAAVTVAMHTASLKRVIFFHRLSAFEGPSGRGREMHLKEDCSGPETKRAAEAALAAIEADAMWSY